MWDDFIIMTTCIILYDPSSEARDSYYSGQPLIIDDMVEKVNQGSRKSPSPHMSYRQHPQRLVCLATRCPTLSNHIEPLVVGWHTLVVTSSYFPTYITCNFRDCYRDCSTGSAQSNKRNMQSVCICTIQQIISQASPFRWQVQWQVLLST